MSLIIDTRAEDVQVGDYIDVPLGDGWARGYILSKTFAQDAPGVVILELAISPSGERYEVRVTRDLNLGLISTEHRKMGYTNAKN